MKSWNVIQLDLIRDLGGNNFRGAISPAIGQAVKLYSLRLNNNRFSGSLPASMKNLKLLQQLIVFDNWLYGRLPVWLSLLERLRNLLSCKSQFRCSLKWIQLISEYTEISGATIMREQYRFILLS